MIITNSKVYDKLKFVAQVLLPAIGALYFALSQTWGLSNGSEVVGTIVALDTFLGVVLHISSKTYEDSDEKYDGEVKITETADKKNYLLQMNDDLENLDDKKHVVLKVNKGSTPVKKTARKRRTSTK